MYAYFVYTYQYGAKHCLIALNIQKWWFCENNNLEVFDFKQCYDFSVNIKFLPADQNLLQRTTFWLLSSSYLHLNKSQLHSSICIFLDIFFFTAACKFAYFQSKFFFQFFFKNLMRSASHPLLRPFAECYKYAYLTLCICIYYYACIRTHK